MPRPTRSRTLAILLALVIASLPALAEEPEAGPTTGTYDWYEGADAFAEALEEAKDEGRAIAVYFYTDWCGYCRQLERELLERATVEGYLKSLTKVRINPEDSKNDQYIAQRYGVNGFPAFFIHADAESGPTKIARMKREGGSYRLKTPDEFVESIRRVVGSD